MAAMTKLTRNQFIPFLDTAKDTTFTASEWKQIELFYNFWINNEWTRRRYGYICYENAVTEINANKPELPQEIACYEGNPIYDFMFKEFFNIPVGSDVKVPFLMCFGGIWKESLEMCCYFNIKGIKYCWWKNSLFQLKWVEILKKELMKLQVVPQNSQKQEVNFKWIIK